MIFEQVLHFQDVEILPRGSGNVIMSNHSLVLQKVMINSGTKEREIKGEFV